MSSPRRLRIPGLPAFDAEDLITALVLSGIGVLFIILGPQERWFSLGLVPEALAQPVLILCGFVGTLYAPRVVLSTASILTGIGIDVLSGGHTFSMWLVFQLVFALVGHAPALVAKVVFTACAAATVVTGLIASASGANLESAFQASLLAAIVLFLPALWASTVREHRSTAAAERLRAEAERTRAEAERERADAQEQLAQLATRTAEVSARLSEQKVRAAAAEDLHDLVAGHIAAIALQSQAALASGDEATRAEVLASVHASADRALDQLRRMIDVLAGEAGDIGAPTSPVAETIMLARGLGITVTGDEVLEDLPAPVEEALRPVFAELIANVVKHAAVREVAITAPRPGTLMVANPAGDRREESPGRGLENITHRLERLGGRATFTHDAGRFAAALDLPAGLPDAPIPAPPTRPSPASARESA